MKQAIVTVTIFDKLVEKYVWARTQGAEHLKEYREDLDELENHRDAALGLCYTQGWLTLDYRLIEMVLPNGDRAFLLL